MLKTEQNTPKMGNRIKRAGKKILSERFGKIGRCSLQTIFEHGQWWLYVVGGKMDGAQFSVVDAEGSNIIDGFDLEMVSDPIE